MSRGADLIRFYGILETLEEKAGGKRRLAECDGHMDWPRRGVYFLFEVGGGPFRYWRWHEGGPRRHRRAETQRRRNPLGQTPSAPRQPENGGRQSPRFDIPSPGGDRDRQDLGRQ
jgi:hypothetical protein